MRSLPRPHNLEKGFRQPAAATCRVTVVPVMLAFTTSSWIPLRARSAAQSTSSATCSMQTSAGNPRGPQLCNRARLDRW